MNVSNATLSMVLQASIRYKIKDATCIWLLWLVWLVLLVWKVLQNASKIYYIQKNDWVV